MTVIGPIEQRRAGSRGRVSSCGSSNLPATLTGRGFSAPLDPAPGLAASIA